MHNRPGYGYKAVGGGVWTVYALKTPHSEPEDPEAMRAKPHHSCRCGLRSGLLILDLHLTVALKPELENKHLGARLKLAMGANRLVQGV